ncbi:zinc/iron regulated transporter-related protein 71B [Arctopsyche grandis]|uniref:zinc/iron regulated transporter-related protein 71B n=1 Tax=Arctopsyche grandis TaxID=121162 RepID=UPI00406D817A
MTARIFLFFVCLVLVKYCKPTEITSSPPASEIDGPPDKFFLKKIFDKYGDADNMTFEGFEHLLDNLGLGGDLFQNPHELNLHRVNGSFKQIHDATHRHKRHSEPKTKTTKLSKCLSPYDMLEIYGIETNPANIQIDQDIFMTLCPALVYQLDQKLCYRVEKHEDNDKDIYLAWIYAGLSVLLISATGLLGVAIMPIMHSKMFDKLLHFLVALAVGTLCGDALLHLLPHALTGHLHDSTDIHDHNTPIFKCGVTLLTVLLFYSIESLMRIATGGSSHGHSHSQKIEDRSKRLSIELDFMLEIKNQRIENKPLSPVALMVILGDALHNVTDGLAIGAAFSSDPVTGFATALAVFCHELPHELGDFAVLLRSGMSMKKAICFNVLSSILSFVGTAAGLWLAEDHESSSQWIYAATAGTFLYIALADLVPELNENGNKSYCEFILAFVGIVCGGGIMLSIALYEDSLKELFNG